MRIALLRNGAPSPTEPAIRSYGCLSYSCLLGPVVDQILPHSVLLHAINANYRKGVLLQTEFSPKIHRIPRTITPEKFNRSIAIIREGASLHNRVFS
jgi:hypothetical protein